MVMFSCYLTNSPDIYLVALKSEPSSRTHIIDLLSSLLPEKPPGSSSRPTKKGKSTSASMQPHTFQATPLTSLFIDGMSENLIWEQLDLRARPICDLLDHVLKVVPEDDDDSVEEEFRSSSTSEVEDSEDMEQDELEEDSFLDHEKGLEDKGDSEDLENESADEASENSSARVSSPQRTTSEGHSELDDSFFNLLSFNAEIEAAETKDAEVNDELDSDVEMPVDWFAPVDDQSDEKGSENDVGGLIWNTSTVPPITHSYLFLQTRIIKISLSLLHHQDQSIKHQTLQRIPGRYGFTMK